MWWGHSALFRFVGRARASCVRRAGMGRTLARGRGLAARSREEGGLAARSREEGGLAARSREEGGLAARSREEGGLAARSREEGGLAARSREDGQATGWGSEHRPRPRATRVRSHSLRPPPVNERRGRSGGHRCVTQQQRFH